MLAELLEARMEVADVRRASGNALAIELEHQANGGVRRGMLRTKVQYPTVGRLDVVFQVIGRLNIEPVALVWLQCVRHN